MTEYEDIEIRKATTDDIAEMTRLGESVVQGPDKSLIDWNAMPSILERYVTNDAFFCAVAEYEGGIVGAIVGGVCPYPWSQDRAVAIVMLIWSSKPGAGTMLISRFVEAAKANGATLVLGSSRDERGASMYKRIGLYEIEANYMGEV